MAVAIGGYDHEGMSIILTDPAKATLLNSR
jgi:hypothetical protein